MKKLKLIVLISLISVSISSFAQEHLHKVGVSVGVDHMILINEVSPRIGFSYEWTPIWCGIETGLYWRTNAKSFDFSIAGSPYLARISTHYLTIPILWTVHLSPVTISVGPELDYYLGYNISKSKTSSNLSIDSYSETRFNIGLALNVGFPIKITENCIFEPRVRTTISGIDYFVGIGVAVKFGR